MVYGYKLYVASCHVSCMLSVVCCMLSVAYLLCQLDVGAFKLLHFIWCTLHAQARRSDRFVLALRKCLGFAPFGHLHLNANSMAACAFFGGERGSGEARRSEGAERRGEARQGRGGERRGWGEGERSEQARDGKEQWSNSQCTGRSRTSTATLSTNLRACACHFGLPKSS